MYFQPSLTASTPTGSIDPLAIPVKKGEIIILQQHLMGSVCLKGRSFRNYFYGFFLFLFFIFFIIIFFYVMVFVFMFWIIVDGL